MARVLFAPVLGFALALVGIVSAAAVVLFATAEPPLKPIYGPLSTYKIVHQPLNSPVPPSFDFTTTLGAGDDRVFTTPIGFTFTLFGVDYTDVTISTNGNAQFVTKSTAFTNGNQVPPPLSVLSALSPFLATFFTDLLVPPERPLLALTTGDAPDRKFIVRFDKVPTYAYPQLTFTFDLLLCETVNKVELRIYEIAGGDSWNGSAQIGLSNVANKAGAFEDWAFLPLVTSSLLPALNTTQVQFIPVEGARARAAAAAAAPTVQ